MKKIIVFCFFILNLGFAKEANFYQEDGVFLRGYDPVSYIKKNKAEKGNEGISSQYKGIKVYFTSKENKDLFLRTPEAFIPAYNGWCAYAMADSGDLVEIDPKSFKVVEGKTYLFYNGFWADTLKKWNKKDDSSQIQKANLNWKKYQKK